MDYLAVLRAERDEAAAALKSAHEVHINAIEEKDPTAIVAALNALNSARFFYLNSEKKIRSAIV
jgi:hypothetical protein